MVKKLFLALLLSIAASADTTLTEKVENLIGTQAYRQHSGLIDIVFTPAEAYYAYGHLDVLKVADTLRENGLLKLDFGAQRELELTFSTEGSPLFFVKLMGEALRSMGFYRYSTEASRMEEGVFYWTIRLQSDHAVDPGLFRQELKKRNCMALDLERSEMQRWSYRIDTSRARMNLDPLTAGREVLFRRMGEAQWLDISRVQRVTLKSRGTNSWYPYITFYDRSLQLLKVYKRDRKTWEVTLNPPRGTVYVKVTDLYSVKNIKDGFRVLPRGAK